MARMAWQKTSLTTSSIPPLRCLLAALGCAHLLPSRAEQSRAVTHVCVHALNVVSSEALRVHRRSPLFSA